MLCLVAMALVVGAASRWEAAFRHFHSWSFNTPPLHAKALQWLHCGLCACDRHAKAKSQLVQTTCRFAPWCREGGGVVRHVTGTKTPVTGWASMSVAPEVSFVRPKRLQSGMRLTA
eukprot:1242443-Amphidinium_carterae.1